MKTKPIWIAPVAVLLVAGSAMAAGMTGGTGGTMMGGTTGGMGTGTGTGGTGTVMGTGTGTGTGSGMGTGTGTGTGTGMGTGGMAGGATGGEGMMFGGGAGFGMKGAGAMKGSMYGNTLNHSYLNELNPIASPDAAVTAINGFLSEAPRTQLQIAELWEYPTVYKAEIEDTDGHLAFDIVADKLTGAVQPEMGLSMMLNASYGAGLQKTRGFPHKLSISSEEATADAQAFLDKNSTVLGYTLGTPEAYPGFYKFHTTDSSGKPGMDIMVNGYNGEIWMDTELGAPMGEDTLPQ